jgi:hypothetical protein
MIAAGHDSSWLRADGQTIWYDARPTAETAPTEGIVTLSIVGGPTRRLTDPATVRRLATEFNGLIRLTPETFSGPMCGPNDQTLTMVFAAPGALAPTITASASGCGIGWDVRGPSGTLPGLDGRGSNLVTEALRLLGLGPTALSAPLPSAGAPAG